MKISVIVPVYKVEKYIEKCLQSLLDQTYTNFEALIINDGSPDQSIAIAKKLVGNDPRFVFLEKENGGLPSARNRGLDLATGEYIAFLDSDDYFASNFLSDMLKVISDNKADIAICDINLVDLCGNLLEKTEQHLNKYYELNDYFLCADTISSYACNKLYKSEIFKTARYDEDVKTYEDSHFTFRTLYKKKIIHVKESLYNYVQRPESITKSLPPTLIKDKLSIIDCYKSFAQQHNIFIEENYWNFCYLKTLVLGPSILIAKYSRNYSQDIDELILKIDYKYFNLNSIISLKKYSKKIFFALLIFKISPNTFYLIIKYLLKI